MVEGTDEYRASSSSSAYGLYGIIGGGVEIKHLLVTCDIAISVSDYFKKDVGRSSYLSHH